MVAVVVVSNVQVIGVDDVQADLFVTGSWGHSLSDVITANVASATPAQAVTFIKNYVAAWALTPGGGGVTLPNTRIWVFGGPQ